MTAPLPPEMALDAEPFTDDELDAALGAGPVVVHRAPDGSDPTFPCCGAWVLERLNDRMTLEPDLVNCPGPLEDHPVRRWRIDGVGTAEWAMAKLAAYEGRIEETREQAQGMRARVDEWEREQTARSAAHAAFFRDHLERYALERREETGEKTLHLPSGRVATTEHKPKAAVEDDWAVFRWAAETLPEADRERVVRMTVKALVGELRTVVTLVEVPDEVAMTCGCIASPRELDGPENDPETRLMPPKTFDGWVVGSAVMCPQCHADALVGQWLSTHLEVRDAKEGRPVPGTRVEPGHVTAKAVPGG